METKYKMAKQEKKSWEFKLVSRITKQKCLEKNQRMPSFNTGKKVADDDDVISYH